MRALASCMLAAVASSYGFVAAAACEHPAAIAVTDGKTATMDQMLAAQQQVKAYQTAMNEFLACIDTELKAEGEQAPEDFKSLMFSRHDAAVAEMEGVAAAFNEQVRAYKAANPTPAAN